MCVAFRFVWVRAKIVSRRAAAMRSERWRVGRWERMVRIDGGEKLGTWMGGGLVEATDAEVGGLEVVAARLDFDLTFDSDFDDLHIDDGVAAEGGASAEAGKERVAMGIYNAARMSGSDFVV